MELEHKSKDCAEQPTDEVLDQGEPQRICPTGQLADQDDVRGLGHGSSKLQAVAEREGEGPLGAQQKQARDGRQRCDPGRPVGQFPPAEGEDQRHQDDVQPGDERSLTG